MDYRKSYRQNDAYHGSSSNDYRRKNNQTGYSGKGFKKSDDVQRSYSDDSEKSYTGKGRKSYSEDNRKSFNGKGRKSYSDNNKNSFDEQSRKSYTTDSQKSYKNDNHRYPKNSFKKDEDPEVQQTIQQTEPEELPYLIIGRNAVREALRNNRSIDRILVSKERDGSLGELVKLTKENNIQYREVDKKKLDELCMPFGHGGKTANHQGIVAYAAGVEYCSIQDILNVAKQRNEAPFVIVLDGIEDPHNLGSIIRSAECAGAHGVILGKRRSASVTPAVIKASCGATEYMKIARVVNISGALEELKRAGLWVAGADMNGVPMSKQGLNGALALVIGGEGNGLTKLVRDTCDFLVSIPLKGNIESLNASVAASVLMFEKCRQDENGGKS